MSFSIRAGLAPDPQPLRWLADASGRRMAFSQYPARDPWLHLLISHGFGEHRGWYAHLAAVLREAGISTYTFDHFHHGISDGAPADVADYAVLTDGLRLALEQGVAPLKAPGAPLALLGHSNGGLTVLRALAESLPAAPSAVVLTNPLLGLPHRIARWGLPLARLLETFHPALRLPTPRKPAKLTGDRSIWQDYARDPLRFRAISVRFFTAMGRAALEAADRRRWGDLPLLLLWGGQDRVVDREASLRWFDRLEAPHKKLIRYPHLSHELFHETQWRAVAADVVAWLRGQVGAPAAAPSQART